MTTDGEHETCDDETCSICLERERALLRRINPGVDRVMRKIAPYVERRRKIPQA